MSPPRPTRSPGSGPRTRNKGTQLSKLRIIGGQWRSRQVTFPCIDGLRPTPDRVRETLFNWLAAQVPGSRCLDLFAGSGALGLEALSRGAALATFVDAGSQPTNALRQNIDRLGLSPDQRAEVRTGDALEFLRVGTETAFDIVFLDPPFRQGWLERLLPRLESGGWVAPGSWIYIEHERELASLAIPPHWHAHRRRDAGQVIYTLYQVTQRTTEGTPS